MNTDADRVIQERLKAILGMIIGVISVKEACARIMLSFTRCKQLRAIALQGSSGPALPLEEILPDARLALNANPTRRLSRHSRRSDGAIAPPSARTCESTSRPFLRTAD
jgi:hypothetical protein